MLHIQELKKQFGGLIALNGIDLHIPEQHILGVIGMNGSGKTTLLNCINGLYKPSAGRIVMRGKNITHLSVSAIARIGIGRTFQVPRVFAHMSLLDNLEVAQLHTQRNASERYESSMTWLERTQLQALRHNMAEELSGGQQKLLELARIMVAAPKVVLLDEPFAGVNPGLAELFIAIIQTLPTEHACSVILVSHDLTSIYQLSHHIIVMNEGRILSQGSADTVRQDPAVIQAYLGN